MGVQVSSSRFQWPSVVSGATTRKGPGMPSSWRWNSSVASDCAVFPRPCAPRVCCSKTLAYPWPGCPAAGAGTPTSPATARSCPGPARPGWCCSRPYAGTPPAGRHLAQAPGSEWRRHAAWKGGRHGRGMPAIAGLHGSTGDTEASAHGVSACAPSRRRGCSCARGAGSASSTAGWPPAAQRTRASGVGPTVSGSLALQSQHALT
jgi:hypothetical protein